MAKRNAAPSLVVEHVAVDQLEPHPRNPREGDVGAIVESIDFVAPVQPGPAVDEHGHPVLRQRVGARVRIPPAVIFPLMRALNEQLERFEREYGQIQPQGGGDDPDR